MYDHKRTFVQKKYVCQYTYNNIYVNIYTLAKNVRLQVHKRVYSVECFNMRMHECAEAHGLKMAGNDL